MGLYMGDTTADTIRRILRSREKSSLDGSALVPAAVMLLLYPKDGEYCILFNRRSREVEYHKGEVSFPGGARDPEDKDMLACALREAREEMGIRPQDVTVLGEMDDEVTRSGFHVSTYAGTIPYPYPFRVSRREVDEVLEVPLSNLRNPRNVIEEAELRPGGYVVRTRSYIYNRSLIWGATARILTRFLGLLS